MYIICGKKWKFFFKYQRDRVKIHTEKYNLVYNMYKKMSRSNFTRNISVVAALYCLYIALVAYNKLVLLSFTSRWNHNNWFCETSGPSSHPPSRSIDTDVRAMTGFCVCIGDAHIHVYRMRVNKTSAWTISLSLFLSLCISHWSHDIGAKSVRLLGTDYDDPDNRTRFA